MINVSYKDFIKRMFCKKNIYYLLNYNNGMNYFDLNIKKILKEWKVADALREIIANAIDESVITQTKSPEIYKENNQWIIEDYGRGITISDFLQDENQEKLNNKNVIGKFGVGLKDSIAVLFRNEVNFSIKTKEFTAYPQEHKKQGFDEETIHMSIDNAKQKMVGTKFIFENVDDIDIENAKNNFLIFKNLQVLFENDFGQIIKSNYDEGSKIYFNGMQISEDKNYSFSYNITKTNKKLSSKMNRERKSLGRDAYSELISKIITPEIPDEVINYFIHDEENSGELTIKKIRKIIYEAINKNENYVFMTKEKYELMSEREREIIKLLGKEIKIIKDVDQDLTDNLCNESDAIKEYEINFKYEEVSKKLLSKWEKMNLEKIEKILKLLDKDKEIVIVRKNNPLNSDYYGFWLPREPQKIFIIKKVLLNWSNLLKTLIHEYAHSISGYEDLTREFEDDLSEAWYKYSQLKKSSEI